jgi:protein involved in polysaccharide export with SLBB domain
MGWFFTLLLLYKRSIAVTLITQVIFFFSVAFAQELPSVTQGFSAPSIKSESFSFDQIKRGKDLLEQQQAFEKQQGNRPETPAATERPQSTDKKLSAFEEYIQGKSTGAISTAITQFGYDLFQQSPDTFAPVDVVPVGPDYLLGPGDEIRLTLWGKVNAEHPTVIDREGKIALPQIGILHLAGLTFSETKNFLETELSRYYKPSEVKMNVSMGRLRSIRVFVVGNAQRPGSYTLSSFSTLINALFASGGPSKAGTMRDIQVKRNGVTQVHFDLYDFLLKGDKTKDIRLMPEDVIFIPPVGPLVGIAGDVKSPAIYELREETKLLDLIWMTGGLASVAFKGRVQVQRIEDHRFRTLFEMDMIGIEKSPEKNIVLQDGDLIKIFPVVETKSTITLTGAVANPGEYGVKSGMTRITDVISKAGGLLYFSSNEVELTRVKVTQKGPQTDRFIIDLFKAMEGDTEQNMLLETNDYLFIKTVPEWQLYRTVRIEGEVRFPGTYTIKKGETLSSLIERAGGFTDNAYLKGAVFTRESVQALQQRQLDESIDRLEQQILSQSAKAIEASLTPEVALQQKASIEQQHSLIAKMRAAKAKGRISIVLTSLEKFKGSPSDLPLEEGDILFIPEKPQQVQVIGAVYNSTAFIYDPKSTVATYIKKAGGVTEGANDSASYLLRVDGTAISKDQAGGFFGGGFMYSKLDPGDTIVVPERTERIYWLREVKDLTQILYQIAVTAGVLIVAF